MNHDEAKTNELLSELLQDMSKVMLPDSADLRIRTALRRDQSTSADTSGILNLEQAAAFLNISMNELIQILDDLPSFEVAGTIRFRRSQLEQWIETREQTLGWQKSQSKLKQPLRIFKIAGG